MCLGEVGQVVGPPVDATVLVRTPQRTLTASLLTLDGPVRPGDWLVVHSGFALARLSPDEAHEAMGLRAGGPDLSRDPRP